MSDRAADPALRPARGARYAVELLSHASDRAVYRGALHLPDASFPLEVVVDAGGAVARIDGPEDVQVHAKPAAALVKAAAKLPRAPGSGGPPRRIVRWREPAGGPGGRADGEPGPRG